MSKTWKKSVIEGATCAAIAFAIVEIAVENTYGWTRELLEYFRVHPDMPNVLQFYIEIQMLKGPWALIVFFIVLVIFTEKLKIKINFWHVVSIIPSLLVYGIYVALKYFYLFT